MAWLNVLPILAVVAAVAPAPEPSATLPIPNDAELIKLPKFYVSVAFHAFAPQDFFVGAEPATKFVRISIDHIARLTPDPERRKKWMDTINERLTPFLRHRGVHWEIHIDETPRDFWTIDGFFPPPTGSSDERRWAEENKPSQPIGG